MYTIGCRSGKPRCRARLPPAGDRRARGLAGCEVKGDQSKIYRGD